VDDEQDAEEHGGIGLAEAIATLRSQLLAARAKAAGADIQLPVESMTVVLRLAAIRNRDGKGGFRVPFVNAELGASAGSQREQTQTVTVVFGAPVDAEGNPVKVAQASEQLKG